MGLLARLRERFFPSPAPIAPMAVVEEVAVVEEPIAPSVTVQAHPVVFLAAASESPFLPPIGGCGWVKAMGSQPSNERSGRHTGRCYNGS